MKFCPSCGSQLNDDTVFCPNCGAQAGDQPAQEVNTPAENSTYTQGPADSGTYAQQTSASSTQQSYSGGGYYQAGNTQNNPGGDYYQPNSTQGYQSAPQTYQSAPQNYQGGPGRPSGSGNNKLIIIIISIVVGLCLIGGGIFAYSKLSGKNDDPSLSNNGSNSTSNVDNSLNNNNGSNSTVSPETSDNYDINNDYQFGDNNVETSDDYDDYDFGDDYDDGDDYDFDDDYDYDYDYDEYTYADINDFLMMYDDYTADDILYAFEDIGLDTAYAQDFYYFGEWLDGYIYSFTYQDSVIDLLMTYDDTVFSVETYGVQVYLAGYESYWLDDYLGATTHYDESYPDDAYVFYLYDTDVSSYISINTSSDLDYVVQLLDPYDGSMVMAFYIWGGNTDFSWYLAVPPGEYTIEYAAGPYWYGIDEIFGPDTVYYRADDVYSFYEGEDTYITLDIYGGTGIPSTDITDEYGY